MGCAARSKSTPHGPDSTTQPHPSLTQQTATVSARRRACDNMCPVIVERVDRRNSADLIGIADVAPAQVFDQSLFQRLRPNQADSTHKIQQR